MWMIHLKRWMRLNNGIIVFLFVVFLFGGIVLAFSRGGNKKSTPETDSALEIRSSISTSTIAVIRGSEITTRKNAVPKFPGNNAFLFQSPKVTSVTVPAEPGTTAGTTTTTTSTSTKTSSTTSTATTTTVSTSKKSAGSEYLKKFSGRRFSHIIVFLDKQRVVFYSTSQEGRSVPEIAFRCSTGLSATPTRTTDHRGPFILSGYKGTKFDWKTCHVRFGTQIVGSYFFHSVPYHHNNGYLEYSMMKTQDYVKLGQKASHGCIRLSLRDARFIFNNTYRGMPVLILSSSQGYSVPDAMPLPRLKSGGSSGWDPTDPECPHQNTDHLKTYRLTYNGNGHDVGSVPADGANPYYSGSLATVLSGHSLSKTGYEFVCWNAKADGSGQRYNAGAAISISGNITLFAEWKKITTPTVPDPTNPPMPSSPTDPPKPNDPPSSSVPTDPSAPVDPPTSGDPTDPSDPSVPADPANPSNPDHSADPAQPA